MEPNFLTILGIGILGAISWDILKLIVVPILRGIGSGFVHVGEFIADMFD